MVCCGPGYLYILENAIDYLETLYLPMPGVRNMWCLKYKKIPFFALSYILTPYFFSDDLIVTTCFETFVMKQTDDNVEDGYILHEPTLSISTNGTIILQVVESKVCLLYDQEILDEWEPPNGAKISVAKTTEENQCILCYGKGNLVYLGVIGNTLIEIWYVSNYYYCHINLQIV